MGSFSKSMVAQGNDRKKRWHSWPNSSDGNGELGRNFSPGSPSVDCPLLVGAPFYLVGPDDPD